MSVAAYGMLLHSYRWKLHYRVAVVMTDQEDHSHMVLARHWLQVGHDVSYVHSTHLAEGGLDSVHSQESLLLVDRRLVSFRFLSAVTTTFA